MYVYWWYFSFVSKILLENNVETWMSKILQEIKSTVCQNLTTAIKQLDEGVHLEEIILNFAAQIGLMCFFYYWTKECERAVVDIRNDRKSLASLMKKFTGLVNRLSHMLSRGVYRPMSVVLSNTQKNRVESILGVCYIFLFLSTMLTCTGHIDIYSTK